MQNRRDFTRMRPFLGMMAPPRVVSAQGAARNFKVA